MSTESPTISPTPSKIARAVMVKLNDLPLEQQQDLNAMRGSYFLWMIRIALSYLRYIRERFTKLVLV